MQPLTHSLRAGRQEENPAQHLTDAFDAEGGILPLQLDDLVRDGFWQPGFSRPRHPGL
jgi:hypothetical protein